MINAILGSKKETSQVFFKGLRVPVTKILAGPCVVTQIKTPEKDGYWAIQLGFGRRKAKNTPKPLQGHLNKNQKAKSEKQNYPRFLKEVKIEKEPTFKVGDVIGVAEIFKVGDVVSVTGTSKGKGFAGGVKRHHFKGGPRTHGQSDRERAPGSIGQTTTPGRVYKGKRMAGRMGGEKVTVKGLHVISVNPEANELFVSGQVPGTAGSLLLIRKIKSGSLEELEHEVVPVVVEGAPAAAEAASGSQGEAEVKEVKQNAEGS